MSEYKRLTNNNLEDYDPEYDFCIECKYFGEPNGCNRPNGTCDSYDRFMETYNRLAELEDKIENGTLKEVEVVKPNCIIYKEKLFVDFICQKCNSIVSFVEAGMLWLLDKSDLSEAKRIETIEQLYPNYCSCCGVKLKENH